VQPDVIQFYEPAQLVIVTGTPDQIDFVKQTIFALRQNIEMMRKKQSKSAESKPKTEAPISSDTAAPK
jgi:type II secretory pathway component GspD/PulD (secretin)